MALREKGVLTTKTSLPKAKDGCGTGLARDIPTGKLSIYGTRTFLGVRERSEVSAKSFHASFRIPGLVFRAQGEARHGLWHSLGDSDKS